MAAMDLGRTKDNAEDGPHDFDKEAMLSMAGGLGKPDLANYVPNQRLEWKRYKQYTRNDIMSAIEEVKNGKKKTTVWKNEKTQCCQLNNFSSIHFFFQECLHCKHLANMACHLEPYMTKLKRWGSLLEDKYSENLCRITLRNSLAFLE